MKERLIELLNGAVDEVKQTCGGANTIADYLLENGVIVPPCKVGDKVYHIRETTCENIDGLYTICEFYRHSGDNLCALPKGKCPNKYRIAECCVSRDNLLIVTEKWGKTVFLTREQAQAKLKEGGKG